MTRHHSEHFQINQYHRRYDRETDRFIINISYETAAPQPTQRVLAVAESFGLGLDQSHRFVIYDNVELKISPHDIVYITGESGSGKSALLKTLENDIKNDMGTTAANINDIQPIPDKPIIETVGTTTEQALELLSRVGLNDAFLFLRTYQQLSDGQKYRYHTAKLIETGAQFWILDEFAATLDRDTAKITAYNIQKLARQHSKAVIAATTHTDLHTDLQPSVHIHKRFGRELQINYYPNQPPQQCTLLNEIHIEPGTRQDYEALAEFHYRSHNLGAVRRIFRAMRKTELAGVIVYTYPAIATTGRRLTLPHMPIRELNQKLSNIMRVVVHPKYRTIGLGQRLVRETLSQSGTPLVETTAVMARYNPFFEHAGMTRIRTTTPTKQALAIRDTLQKLGFNTTLLNSENYALTQIKHLNQTELTTLKQTFTQNYHPRLAKEFFHDEPYGTHKQYQLKLQSASLDKLAKLITITALLLQTKVYLFWRGN
ncbi:MAG TPA: ATP-binding cassette domain-containing protein [Candidatus Bathyarchaeia archaeon]|nr:ATP-binding cassette domain-containing protein [Candidatus Bathyarchaeia archaeon]